MLEKEIKTMLSIDLYNLLMANKKRPDKRTILYVLKERNEIDLIYSLALNF